MNRYSRYGTAHRQLRRQLVERYEASGRGWPCALCDTPMIDDPAELHLHTAATVDGWGWRTAAVTSATPRGSATARAPARTTEARRREPDGDDGQSFQNNRQLSP